jgi:redox-sensitive bicupin YhaK (pirin superfamily)
MDTTRKIRRVLRGVPTIEGAGVHLHRVFGFPEVPLFDPFLLLDDFRGKKPADFLKGFPWHPHRGIETITYVLRGDVEHGDSMGNRGVISAGDVQWMTAGGGVIHQEMPRGAPDGTLAGFQLWANLPAARKMMPPRYRGVVSAEIPEVVLDGGVRIRVICGTVGGRQGPVRDVVIDPEYLDVTVPAGTTHRHPAKRGHTVFAYVIEGRAFFGTERDPFSPEIAGGGSFATRQEPYVADGELVLFGDGSRVEVTTGETAVRFLLISGRPIGEPVAWYGPIVMNTEEELRIAFEQYRDGTFLAAAG